jgi:hypothetical protein
MRRARSTVFSGLVLGMVTATTAMGVTTASAAATNVLAQWDLSDPAGSTVMLDSSGHAINGTVGSAVQTGVVDNGVTLYRWSNVKPNQPPATPERLVQVNSSALNPGTADYAVTVRYRTTHAFGNVIQKGQSGSKGGYFKFQQPKGVMQCLFRGSAGSGAVSSKRALNDGQWHTVRCERTANQVVMTVDGVVTMRINHATGSISNSVPLTIGGKLNCDQITVTCDYFAGDIDYVTIQSGDVSSR